MAEPGQRPDIERKVAQISDRIVRGMQAEKDPAIKISRAYKAASLVASSLTSIGLSNPLIALITGDGKKITVSQAFESWHGLPKMCSFVGIVLFVVTAILMAFYKQGKVEERAVLSLGLFEAFKRLEVELVRHIEKIEPMEQLSSVYDTAIALESSYCQTIPKREDCKKIISDYTISMIRDYCNNWGIVSPELERREK